MDGGVQVAVQRQPTRITVRRRRCDPDPVTKRDLLLNRDWSVAEDHHRWWRRDPQKAVYMEGKRASIRVEGAGFSEVVNVGRIFWDWMRSSIRKARAQLERAVTFP
ncbi:hypothetical protein SLA2020_351790 [Shorea laevis]